MSAPSIERLRSGGFALYVPRQDGEPADQAPYRGEFASWVEASEYARQRFGVSVGGPMGRPPLPPEQRSDAKPRSVRLSEARWTKLKALGSEWLERQIDRAKLPG